MKRIIKGGNMKKIFTIIIIIFLNAGILSADQEPQEPSCYFSIANQVDWYIFKDLQYLGKNTVITQFGIGIGMTAELSRLSDCPNGYSTKASSKFFYNDTDKCYEQKLWLNMNHLNPIISTNIATLKLIPHNNRTGNWVTSEDLKQATGIDIDVSDAKIDYYDIQWEAPIVKVCGKPVNFIPININKNVQWTELHPEKDGTRIFKQENTLAYVTYTGDNVIRNTFLWKDYMDSNIFLLTCEKH